MKNYVITIMDNEKSVQAANRCIRSGMKFRFGIEMFPAVTPKDQPAELMNQQHISTERFQQSKFSRIEPMMAAYMSHYSLWKRCVETREEITVFEHDAVIQDPIPGYLIYDGCINLGRPSYGNWKQPRMLGVNPLTSKRYFPGAHAYRVNPRGAARLVKLATQFAMPADVYLNVELFPWLEEYYPWPVVCDDSFTTIQNLEGCQAKHNFKAGYEIL